MLSIDKCIDWNIAVGNKQGEVDRDLEFAMLQEELDEYKEAKANGDRVEMMDAIIDVLRVAFGSLWKSGTTHGDTNSVNYLEQPLQECAQSTGLVLLLNDFFDNIALKHFTIQELQKGREAVSESNNSKLVDGKAIKNEHGKIMKPEGYRKPDFSFLG